MIEIIDKIRFRLEILWIDHPQIICFFVGFAIGGMVIWLNIYLNGYTTTQLTWVVGHGKNYMEIGGKVMVTKKEFSNSIKKAKDWDGKSRPSNDTYRDSWDRIFGQKEIKELNESLKQSKKNRKEHTENEDWYRIIT